MIWKEIEIALPLSDGTRPAYQCSNCGKISVTKDIRCPSCNQEMRDDDGWRKFSPEYWECKCGYRSIVRTEYCPNCGRRNGK